MTHQKHPLVSYINRKQHKYQSRLEKSVLTKKFQSLNKKRKNRLLSKLRKLTHRLEGMDVAGKTAVAGSIAAGLAFPVETKAQTTDLYYKRSQNQFLIDGTKNGVAIANLDSDPEMEVLISTTTGGFLFEGSGPDEFPQKETGIALNSLSNDFALGDLDGDGDNDIVYEENQAGYDFVTVLLNDGNGGFSRGPGSYTMSTTVLGAIGAANNLDELKLIDFDSDGDLDVLLNEQNSSDLFYFVNDGSGNFGAKTSISPATYDIEDFQFSDLDSDGDQDLVFLDYQRSGVPYNSIVKVIENTNDGPGIPVLTGGANFNGLNVDYFRFDNVSIIDVDGDNDLDVFFIGGASRGYISLNQSTQGTDFSFNTEPVEGIPTGEFINDAIAGDFDADGNGDIIVSQASGTRILTFDGTTLNGENHNLNGEIGDATAAFNHLAVGDIDGEGSLDIIGLDGVADGDPFVYFDRAAPYFNSNPYGYLDFGGSFVVAENTIGSIGHFSEFAESNSDPITASLEGADAAFFSLDPTTRELSINQAFDWELEDRSLEVTLNLSDGTRTRLEQLTVNVLNQAERGGNFTSQSTLFEEGAGLELFQPVDFDQDGDQDIVVTNNRILQNSTVNFIDLPFGFSFNPSSFPAAEVAFIDLDEDGDLDPVTRVFGAIYENENTANLSFGFNQLNAPGFNSFDLIAGDVDKDGIDDVSILSGVGDYTSFYRFEIIEDQAGRVVSEDVIEFRTSGGGGLLEADGEVSDIHLADFDGDGFEDLLVITETGANPGNDFLFSGSSAGITDTPTSLSLSEDNGFHRVAASDLDGDGDLDIVSQRFTDASETVGLDVLLNDGTGTFTISETLQLGGGAREADFKIGDVDGDGLKDIVASHAYDSNTKFAITVWSNDGDGTFSQSQALEDTKGSQLELIDIDADDDLDILIRVDSDDQLRVFENTNEAPTQISLSADSFDEELALDTEIATITVTDENQKDTHVVSLVTGDGVNDAQNGFFDVDGNRLILTRLVDFETITSLNLYLSANDGNGNTFEQALTLTVNDIAEPEPEEPLGLSPEESLNALGIYPNPGTNQITFDFTHDLVGEMKIKVRDLSGKLVRSIAAEKTGETWKGTIDMADATPGAYLVALTIGSNETVFQRWIKK